MNILVLHNIEDMRRARRSILDYIFAFERYQPKHQYTYYRILDPVPDAIRHARWDAVILDSTALGICTVRPRGLFFEVKARWGFLAEPSIVKLVFPQDDANHGGVMDDWFAEWGVQVVFSVRPEHRALLYPKSSQTSDFQFCLAGYVDDRSIAEIGRFSKPFEKRTRLLGQRVTRYPPRGGRQGRLKGLVAEAVKTAAARRGLAGVDISTGAADTLFGDDWFAFLGDCKFVLGTEGGLSLNDPYGEIQDRIAVFLSERPHASFEEVEAACFPGLDGVQIFTGFSPRVLEAALCGASQVLVAGRYIGVLEPGRHYIAVKPDCSNLDEVFEAMRDEKAAQARIAACRETLVENPDFRYSALARRAIEAIEQRRATPDARRIAPDFASLTDSHARAVVAAERRIGFDGAGLFRRAHALLVAQDWRAAMAGDSGGDAPFRAAATALAVAAVQAEMEQDVLTASLVADALAAAARVVADASSVERTAPEATGDATTRLTEALERLAVKIPPPEKPLVVAAAEKLATREGADIGARALAAIEAGGETAAAIAMLAHDPPEDVLSALRPFLNASTAAGSWADDDRRRAAWSATLAQNAPADSELGRLTAALSSAGATGVGLVSRLAPSGFKGFTDTERARLAAVDRVLILAKGSADLVDALADFLPALQSPPGDTARKRLRLLRELAMLAPSDAAWGALERLVAALPGLSLDGGSETETGIETAAHLVAAVRRDDVRSSLSALAQNPSHELASLVAKLVDMADDPNSGPVIKAYPGVVAGAMDSAVAGGLQRSILRLIAPRREPT
jgi:hypothetical protein